MSELPPGFILDRSAAPALPPGFVLDSPSVTADVAKSAGVGVAQGVIGLAGLFGDATNFGAQGIEAATNYVSDKLGVERYKRPDAPSLLNNIPTGQSLRKAVEGITGEFYKPKTVAGEYAQTAGEFLPALIGGPEALGAKLLTRVAAPAAVSETAGQLSKGTEAEPYLRVAGALAGGAGATKLANTIAESRAVKAATPALADVKTDASNAYDALTSRNVATPISQATLDNLATDISTTLKNKGIRPSNADSIHRAVEEIRSPATAGAADVADLVAARQSIKGQLSDPSANKAGAFVALGKIENAIEQHSPGTMAKIKEADKNWSAVRANEALDKKIARAELAAAGEHSGFNVGNKIRQQVKNLLNSSEAQYLSAETKADLEKVVRGTWTSNGIRAVSKLFGAGGGLGMLAGAGAGYHEGGVGGAIAAGLAGRGLGRLDAVLTAQRASRTAQNIRLRSPLGQASPLALPPMSNPLLSASIPALLARPRD